MEAFVDQDSLEPVSMGILEWSSYFFVVFQKGPYLAEKSFWLAVVLLKDPLECLVCRESSLDLGSKSLPGACLSMTLC